MIKIVVYIINFLKMDNVLIQILNVLIIIISQMIIVVNKIIFGMQI